MSYLEWIRSQTGSRKIILVYATVILHDQEGRILVQQRTDFDWWGLPGGILEWNEQISCCGHRELLEETGLRAGELNLVGIYTDPSYDVDYPNGDQVQQFTICLSGTWCGGKLTPDDVETAALAFIPIEKLPIEQMPLWYAHMVRDYLNGLEPAFDPLRPNSDTGPLSDTTKKKCTFPNPLPESISGRAMGLVVDPAGRVLAMTVEETEEILLPTDIVNLGENATDAVVRIVGRETGLNYFPHRLMGVISNNGRMKEHGNPDFPAGSVTAVYQGKVTNATHLPDRFVWRRREELASVGSSSDPHKRLIWDCFSSGSFVV